LCRCPTMQLMMMLMMMILMILLREIILILDHCTAITRTTRQSHDNGAFFARLHRPLSLRINIALAHFFPQARWGNMRAV
jgi:hypothetical protein